MKVYRHDYFDYYIVIYNETKQTNRLTRTFKKCIRILHVGGAAFFCGVKSGPRTRVDKG